MTYYYKDITNTCILQNSLFVENYIYIGAVVMVMNVLYEFTLQLSKMGFIYKLGLCINSRN